MARLGLQYIPVWEPEFKGYSIRAVRRFYGTLSRQHEFADLMQESYLVFLRCGKRYSVDNARWFMALYKRALYWRLCDLVKALQPYSYPEEPENLDIGALSFSLELFEVLEAMPLELRLVATDLSRPALRLLKVGSVRNRFSAELRRYLIHQGQERINGSKEKGNKGKEEDSSEAGKRQGGSAGSLAVG